MEDQEYVRGSRWIPQYESNLTKSINLSVQMNELQKRFFQLDQNQHDSIETRFTLKGIYEYKKEP